MLTKICYPATKLLNSTYTRRGKKNAELKIRNKMKKEIKLLLFNEISPFPLVYIDFLAEILQDGNHLMIYLSEFCRKFPLTFWGGMHENAEGAS